MSDEISPDIAALYRSTARELPGDNLDHIVLGRARAVAWRRRNRSLLLAMASCGTLAVVIGIWSASLPTRTHPAIDISQIGLTAGRPQPYAIDAHAIGYRHADEPGMASNPALTAGMWTKSDIHSGDAL